MKTSSIVLPKEHYPNPTKAALHIYETLYHPHLTSDVVIRHAKSRLMLALVDQLLPLIRQITSSDTEIEYLFLTHEDNEVFSHLPRAGKRLAPRLLAEIGDDWKHDAGAARNRAGRSHV